MFIPDPDLDILPIPDPQHFGSRRINLRIHNIACGPYVVCAPESNMVDEKKVVRRIKQKSARGHFCTWWSKMETFCCKWWLHFITNPKSMHGGLD
jgi:hypothetical protein